jgi:Fe2+ transport system protein FeoA
MPFGGFGGEFIGARTMTRSRPPAPANAQVPLDRAPRGRPVRIRSLSAPDPDTLVRLASLGLRPGAVAEVVRRAPVLCVCVDGVCCAIERPVAHGIWVEVGP